MLKIYNNVNSAYFIMIIILLMCDFVRYLCGTLFRGIRTVGKHYITINTKVRAQGLRHSHSLYPLVHMNI